MDPRHQKVLRHGGFDWKGKRVGREELELIVEIVREYPNRRKQRIGAEVKQIYVLPLHRRARRRLRQT